MRGLLGVLVAAAGCGASGGADGGAPASHPADTVAVAVASSFAPLQARLARAFTADSGIPVRASSGSSGQLFAQIVHGAPFDVFLSADAVRPRRLEEEGMAVPGSRFTYAVGRLALYGPGLDSVRADAADLRGAAVRRVAIANPRLAPYGAAARQALDRLGLWETLSDRVLRAENVAQAFQFVASGGAEAGFVALAHVVREPPAAYWVVPAALHDPIRQDAVLLRRGAEDSGARAYLAFLAGDAAAARIREAGYDTPSRTTPP